MQATVKVCFMIVPYPADSLFHRQILQFSKHDPLLAALRHTEPDRAFVLMKYGVLKGPFSNFEF